MSKIVYLRMLGTQSKNGNLRRTVLKYSAVEAMYNIFHVLQ